MRIFRFGLALVGLAWNVAYGAVPDYAGPAPQATGSGLATAVFAGGCFWGVDAVFKHLGHTPKHGPKSTPPPDGGSDLPILPFARSRRLARPALPSRYSRDAPPAAPPGPPRPRERRRAPPHPLD